MHPMFSLDGKNAFITGAAGGIGRAVAERFIQAGASVVITDIVDSQVVATQIGAQFIQADVGSEESINQWGVFFGLKHAPGVMNDGGSIINTASLAAIIKMAGSGAYSATKAAVVSMTKMAALELGHRGIRVNAVCPGYIDTALGSGDEGKMISEQFTALGRVGTPEDLSGVFHFLAAEESAYMTGQALVVDGGWSCGPTPQVLETILGSSTVS